MFRIHHDDADLISKAMRSYVLLPGSLDIRISEIHQASEVPRLFVLIVDSTVGSLDYFVHAKEVVNDHGFAQPHEFMDFLKRRFTAKQLKLDGIWTCLKVRAIEWPDNLKAVDATLFKLRFLTNVNAARK